MHLDTDSVTPETLAKFMDWLTIALLAGGIIFGILSGLRKQLATPLAIIAALIFSYFFQPVMLRLLTSCFDDSGSAKVASWVIAAPVSFYLFRVLWVLIIPRIFTSVGRLDQGLGAALGLIKGGLFAAVIIGVLAYIGADDWRQHSIVADRLATIVEKIGDSETVTNTREIVSDAFAKRGRGESITDKIKSRFQSKPK